MSPTTTMAIIVMEECRNLEGNNDGAIIVIVPASFFTHAMTVLSAELLSENDGAAC